MPKLLQVSCGWHGFCVTLTTTLTKGLNTMKFSLEIGEAEKHTIEYQFNQLLGILSIKVNEKSVKKHVRLFDEPIKELHVFVVGTHEKLAVKIEKERKLLFGQKNRVFVNERLVKYCEGI